MMNSNGVQRLTPTLMNHPQGHMTHYSDFAAYPWQPGTVDPDRPDGALDEQGRRSLKWPILVYYPNTSAPSVIYFFDGSFRHSNGSKWGRPERWAYIRHTPEVWHDALQQFVVPGLVPVPADPAKPAQGAGIPKSLQYIVDGLKIRYTTKEIMDAMDASPFDEPSEGAPLPTGPVAS